MGLLESWPVTQEDHWIPIRVLPQSNTLAVVSRHGRDTWAVFSFDPVSKRHLELLAGHETDDIVHLLGLSDGRVDRVVTEGMRPRTYWFDSRWAAIQKGIDAALPGRTNRLSGDKSGTVLIHSLGDVDPGRWFVLDSGTGKMHQLYEAMRGIDQAKMRPMQVIDYKARDGLTIPAYLTLPDVPAGSPVGTVVLIHGGPQVRDSWNWDEEVQLLARAGFAVLQPQFRGSAGFGRRFEEAGYRQWGRAMQDDITDGVLHLIERKLADPARVCIYGASYGGYAALWGVIKTPELFRCGVSFAGVSDLAEWLDSSFLDDSTPLVREIRRRRVGDPKRELAALDEVSPLKHASQVRVPMLIAHGMEDQRVLPSQSRQMVRALEREGRSVQWMPFDDEGHGLGGVAARAQFYATLLNFLDQHLASAPLQTQGPSAPKP